MVTPPPTPPPKIHLEIFREACFTFFSKNVHFECLFWTFASKIHIFFPPKFLSSNFYLIICLKKSKNNIEIRPNFTYSVSRDLETGSAVPKALHLLKLWCRYFFFYFFFLSVIFLSFLNTFLHLNLLEKTKDSFHRSWNRL